eukprot:gb/GFBE01009085.1/.p1 GENE.gb/GFBE01009085.1/~~gb/GFBE01009085.1/.p1  ORF type:complete len:771 (+),score=149.00 gb/GFBE01009085.1/:1-2313(+)
MDVSAVVEAFKASALWRELRVQLFGILSALDKDKNGFLDRWELTDAFKLIGFDQGSVDAVLAEADASKDGLVSMEELLTWILESPEESRRRKEVLEAALLQHIRSFNVSKTNVNAATVEDVPLVIFASESGCLGAVRLLTEMRADLNASAPSDYPYYGGTALTVASYRGHAEIVRALAESRANLNACSVSKKTALAYAAEQGHEAVLRVLVEHQASDFVLRGTSVALQYLFLHKRLLCVDNFPASESSRNVLTAAQNGDPESLRRLISQGADLNIRSQDGETALIWLCANSGHNRCFHLILGARADVNAMSWAGSTAAMWAAKRRKQNWLQMLIDEGADLITKAPKINRFFSKQCVLQIVEGQGLDVEMMIPYIDWLDSAATLPGMERAVADEPPNLLSGSLYWALWDVNGAVRCAELTYRLAHIMDRCLQNCMAQQTSEGAKQVLALLLSVGTLRALRFTSVQREEELKQFNKVVLHNLRKSCDERQLCLQCTAHLTPDPNQYFEHRDRHGALTSSAPDQRDAMPAAVWEWLEDLPGDNFSRLRVAFEAFRLIGASLSEEGQRSGPVTPGKFARFLMDKGLRKDRNFFARAAAMVLVEYARLIDCRFREFMEGNFGDAFHSAPIKQMSRILTKMQADYPSLRDDKVAACDAELRCSYFRLADIVRGSVCADGDEEIVQVVTQLQQLGSASELGSFECWRIKNTHHAAAGEEVVGGYRDVKVIGKFSAGCASETGLPLSMVVEVQVIDRQFLDIKKYMHKPYSIERGDFD